MKTPLAKGALSAGVSRVPFPGLDRHLYGVLLIAAATVMWSTAGLFVRALDMDTWSLVAWRSLFAAVSLTGTAVLLRGRTLLRFSRSIGPGGLASIPAMVAAMFSYIAALNMTSVANVMVIYATVPFVAMILAFLLLREKPTRRAVTAAGVAFAGVTVMAVSERGASDLAGNSLAFLMTLGFGASIVISRRWPEQDTIFVTAIASTICAVACFAVVWSQPAALSAPHLGQMGLLLLFSLSTQSLSYIFFLVGSRHVPSSDAGLMALGDVGLAPLWVWLAFSEKPGTPALVGGLIVMLSVGGYLVLQRARPPVPAMPVG
ncbi:DMT family transporter [Acetobacter conturbans]|uniref:EamA family transporter n=1 Tax=Acetobacter conturbans TaxID=1737472 RepID=A0ABX0JUW5_9PROT|nr:DMT family transporter [Acetobacter conturbans]NHN87167.1 EamA family transporter [Acetobacter conturbans]